MHKQSMWLALISIVPLPELREYLLPLNGSKQVGGVYRVGHDGHGGSGGGGCVVFGGGGGGRSPL